MEKKKIILISGIAGSGKDTFFKLADEIFPNQFERFAFADELKKEIAPEIQSKYGIDVFICSREDKVKIRNELVEYGMKKRQESDGRYWIDKLKESISGCEKVPMITDFRFLNERLVLEEFFETASIHLEIFCPKRGIGYQPVIEEEIKNNPDLKRVADFKVFWPDSKGNVRLLGSYVEEAIEKIREKMKF